MNIMKKSYLVVSIILIIYIVYFSLIIKAGIEYYGKDSLILIFIILINGPIFLYLLGTHEGLEKWLKRLDSKND